jgi:D-alanyl-lipoteichoic acid acyltransferase DltB (MBOAT superfamily)
LPISFIGYFVLNNYYPAAAGKAWLVGSSLVFYSYWSIQYLPLLLGSILANFTIGSVLSQQRSHYKKTVIVLTFGVAANLTLLAYFKYTGWLIENINQLAGAHQTIPNIVLPLGISFFTFTQIAFLVDSSRGYAKEYNFINYALFVTFFPHLIAGPILHHKEMMDQFNSRTNLKLDQVNIAAGLFIFSLGVFKKVAVADTFAVWANAGFDGTGALSFFAAWSTSLSYTFQLYFDFSGYCDMAIGSALLFNIVLPINFNSPYQALDIQDFWRRWHITLSRFLKDYLYIPLGGNRVSETRLYLNLFMTFLLGGLWHGASWMFVIWGGLHGGALVLHRAWSKSEMTLPRPVAWLVTFLFINFTWIFFRANSLESALRVFAGMVDIRSSMSTSTIIELSRFGWLSDIALASLPVGFVSHLAASVAIALAAMLIPLRNSQQLMFSGVSTLKLSAAEVLLLVSLALMTATASPAFLYYNF